MEEKDKNKPSVGLKVLEKIQKQHLKPSPRWVFIFKNYSAWIVGILSLLVGTAASSVVFYMLINNDWDIYNKVNNSLAGFVLATLPYFWIILLVLLIILTDYNLKNTKSGYKYSTSIVFISTFSVSIFLGALLYNFGIGKMIDDVFADNVPVYEKMFHKMNHRKRIWMNPDRGLLIGVVSEQNPEENNFVIEDFNNDRWVIISEKAEFIGKENPETGDGVRIIGERRDKNSFIAFRIFYLPEKRWLTPPPIPMPGPYDMFFGPPPR